MKIKEVLVGLIELESEPIFRPLEKSYIEPNFLYKFLYKDTRKGEVYILQRNDNNQEYLLVIDNKNFELKVKIPIDNGYLLDFVVRI